MQWLMSQERRSYYRILHVQPEAPAEIIAAAYRCLMTTLRHHPDRGGDHATAVRINQAYAVLSDPAKRKQYDRARRKRPLSTTHAHGGGDAEHNSPRPLRSCPFCESAIPRQIAIDTRCQRCSSPLAPIAHSLTAARELFGRRSAPRVVKNFAALVHTTGSAEPSRAQLRDLSATGVSLFTAARVRAGTNIRIEAPGMDLVGHVVKVLPRERVLLVAACLLTALFTRKSGVFTSETV